VITDGNVEVAVGAEAHLAPDGVFAEKGRLRQVIYDTRFAYAAVVLLSEPHDLGPRGSLPYRLREV